MKKLIAAIIAILMCGSVFCGCVKTGGNGQGNGTENNQPSDGDENTPGGGEEENPDDEQQPPVEEKDWFELLSDDYKANLILGRVIIK